LLVLVPCATVWHLWSHVLATLTTWQMKVSYASRSCISMILGQNVMSTQSTEFLAPEVLPLVGSGSGGTCKKLPFT